jgi:hypothetical protein
MASLEFVGDLLASPLCDLLSADKPDAPKKTPGAYILVAGSGTVFRYPRGESPVFYIGKATGVRGRLLTHRKNILQAMTAGAHVYGPVREYGAAFGAYYSFIRATDEYSPSELEDLLMARFAKRYRSLPVANSAAGWKRIRRIISCESRSDPGSTSVV